VRSGPRWSRPEQGFLLPPDRRRLWIGFAIGVLGPIVITPIVRLELFSGLPAAPYLLVVVLATFFGRMLAAAAATLVSMVMVDRYFIATRGDFLAQSWRGLVSITIFTVVAFVVAQLLVRLDRAAQAGEVELDRLSLLARAGDAVSGPLDVDAALRRLGDVLVPALADWFSVSLVDESGAIQSALVVHPDPAKLAFVRELQERFPPGPDAPSGAAHVIRTGVSELTEQISEETLSTLATDEELSRATRALGLRCAIVVPLTARGRTLGALSLAGAESHERYGVKDLRLAEEIGDRAALAIDTARLLAAERRARAEALAEAGRNAILKDVTAAFGRARAVEDVMAAVLNEGIRPAGAAAGTVGLVSGGRVELAGATGYEVDDHPYWHSFGLDEPLPMAEAIVRREPVVVGTTAERDRRYPALGGRGEQRDHVLVCVPLLLGDEAVGAFSASYPPDTPFTDADLTFLRALGEQCAQAIERVRSVGREAATRARFDALARASRALARTLDVVETESSVLRLAGEHLGRTANLYARERGRSILLASATPEGVRSGADLLPTADPAPAIALAIARAAEEHGPQVLDAADGADRSVLVLPLGIAGSVTNVLVVIEPTRDFHVPDELAFGRELARRMARALENARLYRERDYVARTLQRSLLPPSLPQVPGLEIEALFRPAVRSHEVGGDFYDVFSVSNGRWAAVIGDVCGKGVEAATLTGLARHTLRALTDIRRPSEALSALNAALLREQLDGRFITVAYALIEPRRGGGARVQVASGGHPLPQRLWPDGRMERVGRHGTLLGVASKPSLGDEELELDPGAALVLFTDGILNKDETSGDVPAGLVRALRGLRAESADQIRERVERYVQDVAAQGQDDDIAILVLRAR
jgi:serine phosphatase RsbU (regulator of sigma subunit)